MSRPSREYRQDAHTASLFVWMLLCASVAAFLFVHSGKLLSRPLAMAEMAGGVALLIFGPVGLAVYLYRARRVWVSVEPSKGITESGRTFIPWEAIERIERRKPLLRGKGGPAELSALKAGDFFEDSPAWGGCFLFPEGTLVFLTIGLLVLAGVLLYWLVFVAFIPLLIVPVLEVYAPLGERVIIVLRSGRPLVLRDLRDAGDLLWQVRGRVEVVER